MYTDINFDQDAYVKAYKALYIIFIILILLANGLLIFKNGRKGDFMYKPKTLTILSLAIGDVFLALFAMVVQTKIVFGDYMFTGLSCSLMRAVFVYSPFLITFVYGIGLMVLGFEIIQSLKTSVTNKNTQIIYALAYSSFPWILGLIVVLPLGMANYDIDTCQGSQTLDQARALVVIGIILPACGSVLTSMIVRRSQPINSPVYVQTQAQPYHPQQPQQFIYQPPTQGQPQQVYNQPTQTYAQTQYANPIHYPVNPNDQPGNVIQPVTFLSDTVPKMNRLILISFVYFVLVIPTAIYYLSYLLNLNHADLAPIPLAAIDGFVMWTNIIRSFITPLLMYGYSDN